MTTLMMMMTAMATTRHSTAIEPVTVLVDIDTHAAAGAAAAADDEVMKHQILADILVVLLYCYC